VKTLANNFFLGGETKFTVPVFVLNRWFRRLCSATRKTQDFNFFKSLHHPNSRLENIFILYAPFLNSVFKKYSEKNIGGTFVPHFNPPPPKLRLRRYSKNSLWISVISNCFFLIPLSERFQISIMGQNSCRKLWHSFAHRVLFVILIIPVTLCGHNVNCFLQF